MEFFPYHLRTIWVICEYSLGLFPCAGYLPDSRFTKIMRTIGIDKWHSMVPKPQTQYTLFEMLGNYNLNEIHFSFQPVIGLPSIFACS